MFPTFDVDGVTVSRVSAQVHFFIDRFDGEEAQVAAAIESVIQLVGARMTFYTFEEMKRPRKIKPGFLAEAPALATKRVRGRISLGLHMYERRPGKEFDREVGPSGFNYFVTPMSLPGEPGTFTVSLPPEMLTGDRRAFLDFVFSLADLLPVHSGVAGFGVLFDDCDLMSPRNRAHRAWAGRYLGLDFPVHPYGLGPYLQGVGWLTMLGERFLPALGGADGLRAALGPGFVVHERARCVVIQAGESPTMGDVNEGDDLRAYQRVNDLLRPLRIPAVVPVPGWDDESTMRWLERLDSP